MAQAHIHRGMAGPATVSRSVNTKITIILTSMYISSDIELVRCKNATKTRANVRLTRSQNARSIWYHDHADGITTMNCFRGLIGTYIIYDPEEDKLGLPTGKYDVPLMMTDKMYTDSGDLVSVANESEDFVGDIMEVNGQPWPYLEVEPRKYRLRLYNTATSRPLDLHVEQSNGDWLDFQVIASDSGLFGSPVNSNDVVIAMGERYEIVVDFSAFANQNLTLKNAFSLMGQGYTQFANMDLVMSFVVGNTVNDWSSNDVPSTLNPNIDWPEDRDQIDHTFRFQRGGGTYIMILTSGTSLTNIFKIMYGRSTVLISTTSTIAYLRDRLRAPSNVGDWSMLEVQGTIRFMSTS